MGNNGEEMSVAAGVLWGDGADARAALASAWWGLIIGSGT
jgi:hypothetical protein